MDDAVTPMEVIASDHLTFVSVSHGARVVEDQAGKGTGQDGQRRAPDALDLAKPRVPVGASDGLVQGTVWRGIARCKWHVLARRRRSCRI